MAKGSESRQTATHHETMKRPKKMGKRKRGMMKKGYSAGGGVRMKAM